MSENSKTNTIIENPEQIRANKIKLEPLDKSPKITNRDQSKPQDEKDNLIQQKPPKEGNNVDLETTTRDEGNKKPAPLSARKKNYFLNLSKTKLKVKKFMTSKPVQMGMLILIIVYSLLVFINLAIDDIIEDEDESEKVVKDLEIVELIILIIFTAEIIASAYGQGWIKYFKDKWLLFDTIVILFSIILVILDLSLDMDKQVKTISSVVRGIFRFLRIFLLIRKAHTLKKIKTTSKVKTPAEKIMEILQEIKDMFETTDIITDIEWVIEKIGSGNIYQPIIAEGTGQGDVMNWIGYGASSQNQQSEEQKAAMVQKSSQQGSFSLKISPEDQLILRIIPLQALKMFDQDFDELSFNCFNLQKILKGQELSYGILYLYQRHQIFSQLKIDVNKFKILTKTIQDGYKQNPYHNSLHAFDVLQTLNFLIMKGKFIEKSNLSALDLASIYFAAMIHDYEHPGLTNDFLKNTSDDLAILYNDVAVLENYHVSETFTLLFSENEKYNITEHFSDNDYKRFRNVVVSAVLNTDMSKHFTELAKVKTRLTQADFDIKDKDKMMCLETMLHTCDISNPIKYWDCCYQWTQNVMQEFWKQGDLEREYNLPISYLADRYTVNTAKSQGGFIDFVVKPTFDVVANFLPEIQPYLKNFQDNKDRWKLLIPEYDKQLEKLKQEKEKSSLSNINQEN